MHRIVEIFSEHNKYARIFINAGSKGSGRSSGKVEGTRGGVDLSLSKMISRLGTSTVVGQKKVELPMSINIPHYIFGKEESTSGAAMVSYPYLTAQIIATSGAAIPASSEFGFDTTDNDAALDLAFIVPPVSRCESADSFAICFDICSNTFVCSISYRGLGMRSRCDRADFQLGEQQGGLPTESNEGLDSPSRQDLRRRVRDQHDRHAAEESSSLRFEESLEACDVRSHSGVID